MVFNLIMSWLQKNGTPDMKAAAAIADNLTSRNPTEKAKKDFATVIASVAKTPEERKSIEKLAAMLNVDAANLNKITGGK
jgi:hypothetical protein